MSRLGSWLLLVALVVVAVLLVAAVAGRVTHRSATVLLAGTPDEVMRDLRLGLAALPRHSVVQDSPRSAVVSFPFTPAWALLACVVFFPVGLLALLARRRESATLIVEAAGERRTRLHLAGRFSGSGIAAINLVIGARSSEG